MPVYYNNTLHRPYENTRRGSAEHKLPCLIENLWAIDLIVR